MSETAATGLPTLPNSEMWMTQEERRRFSPDAFEANFRILGERVQEQVIRVEIIAAKIDDRRERNP